ncbi:uncharacterized protein LAESUDRAFT_322896 [Laetiporus sulphureus 93-53]|uniref:CHAT domain-containing protein n=1 Tax=Laetiporus sulphureus 93-53 TaxID=1314785 RepID=A0A165D2A4_9APHY|nr:uncharacterized protein LAESUDRAFT_322896 [Laetiporus sulphureus 93-53]KZT04010.1 hypothetical protein LAESUDRAFT_322896 [Laetiporus sulphureus 93-53]
MRNHSWVHFACHGTQGIPNPLDSALILHDGRLTMSSLICTERLGHADFAFLSACETAAGAENLVANAAHLTEAMQRAGYRSIISMAGKPDSTKAAIALHYATKMLRERGAQSKTMSFSWVPFIHVGL